MRVDPRVATVRGVSAVTDVAALFPSLAVLAPSSHNTTTISSKKDPLQQQHTSSRAKAVRATTPEEKEERRLAMAVRLAASGGSSATAVAATALSPNNQSGGRVYSLLMSPERRQRARQSGDGASNSPNDHRPRPLVTTWMTVGSATGLVERKPIQLMYYPFTPPPLHYPITSRITPFLASIFHLFHQSPVINHFVTHPGLLRRHRHRLPCTGTTTTTTITIATRRRRRTVAATSHVGREAGPPACASLPSPPPTPATTAVLIAGQPLPPPPPLLPVPLLLPTHGCPGRHQPALTPTHPRP